MCERRIRGLRAGPYIPTIQAADVRCAISRRPARSTRLRRISIELQESRPRRRPRVASANPPMLDVVRESSGPCSDLVWMCEREGFAFSKPPMVGEKKIDGLALSDGYHPIHGFSAAYMDDPGLASVALGSGSGSEISKRKTEMAKVNPPPSPSSSLSSSSTAKGPPKTPSAHAVFTSSPRISASFLPWFRVRRPRRL